MSGRPADGDICYMNDLWLLDVTSASCADWTWESRLCSPIAPSPRDLPAILVVGNRLLLFGGFGLKEGQPDISKEEDEDTDIGADNDADSKLVTEELEVGIDADSDAGATEMPEPAQIGGDQHVFDPSLFAYQGSEVPKEVAEAFSCCPPLAALTLENKDDVKIETFEESAIEDSSDSDQDVLDYLGDLWEIDLDSMTTTCISTDILHCRRGSTFTLLESGTEKAGGQMLVGLFGGFAEEFGFFGREIFCISPSM
jgi:hypothetical protein